MKRKLIIGALFLVVSASFVEILLYFVVGERTGLRLGVPTISDVFSPTVYSPYIKQSEDVKTFNLQRITDFTGQLYAFDSANSSFVKTADASYVVGGNVSKVSTITNSNPPSGVDITLKNTKKDEFIVHLSASEAQFAKVYLRTPTSFNITREKKLLSDIKVDEYVVVKRSINLLNSQEVNIDVEILNN